MKRTQFIKQVILEAAHHTVAPKLTRLYLLLFSVTSIYTANRTNSPCPLLLRSNTTTVCSTTQHILVFSRDLFLAICYLSECLLNNVVCLPLVTNARINLWSHAGRRNGLQSATTNKFLITDPAICSNFHMPHSYRNRFQPGHIQCAADIHQ